MLMIEDLRRVLRVIEAGSVTKAAEELFITQPALTLAIKRIEEQLGLKIFRHEGKKLVLTKKGAESLFLIERIVTLWERLSEQKKFSGKQICTIGVYDNAALLLAPIFSRYFRSPVLDLEIIIDNSEKLFTRLAQGILDICICVFDDEKELPQNCRVAAGYSEVLLPVCAKSIKEDTKIVRYILYNRGSLTRRYIDRQFAKQGIMPIVIAESTSSLFIKQLALLGSGIALLPESFVREEVRNNMLSLVNLSFRFERKIGIYYALADHSPEKEKLLSEITNHLIG